VSEEWKRVRDEAEELSKFFESEEVGNRQLRKLYNIFLAKLYEVEKEKKVGEKLNDWKKELVIGLYRVRYNMVRKDKKGENGEIDKLLKKFEMWEKDLLTLGSLAEFENWLRNKVDVLEVSYVLLSEKERDGKRKRSS